MARVRKEHIEALRPFLLGERPREDGEWDMYCPLHADGKRSAGLNIDKGVWFCAAGCGGGSVRELMLRRAEWRNPPAGGFEGASGTGTQDNDPATLTRGASATGEVISDADIAGWVAALTENTGALDELQHRRQLTRDTLIKFEIGWDAKQGAYTIPIRDAERGILNIRRYVIDPPANRRKIWSVNGMGSPRLYPVSILENDPPRIVICEGEWDAMLTNQMGFPAITRTGAAKVWKGSWNMTFKDKVVYLCHDADEVGVAGNRAVGRQLIKVADAVRVVRLPYEITKNHGKDLTDYWADGHSAEDFKRLLEAATEFDPTAAPGAREPLDARVLDAFDGRMLGRPLRFNVTIKGRREPGSVVPKKVKYTCTKDAGDKCNTCPLFEADGEDTLEFKPHDPVTLEMCGSTKAQMRDVLREKYGIPRCSKVQIDALEHNSVEVLLGRPSIDNTQGDNASDYKTIKITSVGKHDTLANNTVQVVGALYPDPRTQANEFLAWGVNRLQTSIDSYAPDRETLRLLHRFRPRKGQKPLAKVGQIANELATHVTKIYGRPEMHAAIDLSFHSALAFKFGGRLESRGWLELLIIGDTRTGKSEAATRLCDHYGAGEVVSCESASFAGIVGGAQQMQGKEWMITWGAVPINDRRLVVLDEVGGLTPQEIASMSSVRSSGIAEITKIAQERTHARTRLIWLGNPRDSTMSNYTYGVQAIRPLIGNAEDIARFDLAMSVQSGDVDMGLINQAPPTGELRYPTELCHALIRWIWSRTADQIKFTDGATAAVYGAARTMGGLYVEDPPLVQAANVRLKIARTAVAIAGRLFSADSDYACIVVEKGHVEAAVEFMHKLYGMEGFGYAELSRERIDDKREALDSSDEMRHYLKSHKGLAKFLRNSNTFRRQDLEEMMNFSREEAGAVINTLWNSRMVRKDKMDVRVEPALHTLLREIK